jgi:hypothetical protein
MESYINYCESWKEIAFFYCGRTELQFLYLSIVGL